MSWCIYKHTNKINGKVYIGQTCQKPERRWQQGKGYQGSPKFWPAIVEYGWDNFTHEILTTGIPTQEEANQQEQYWIMFYNSYDNGYNATPGGTWDEIEVICIEDEKIFPSLNACARYYNLSSQNLSQNCCKNHKTLKGKHFAYLGEWLQETWQPAEPYDTERRHIASSLKKAVYCLEHNRFYDSQSAAAAATGCSSNQVSACCLGKIISTQGFHFCFQDDWSETWQPRQAKSIHPNGLSAQAKHNMQCAALASKGIAVTQLSKNLHIIQQYNNYQEAADATGLSKDCIGKCVRRNATRTENYATSGGYIWLKTEQVYCND